MEEVVTEADKQREHQQKLARIESRKAAFACSPFWFTVWDTLDTLLRSGFKVMFWLAFWSLVTQCTCGGCIWKP